MKEHLPNPTPVPGTFYLESLGCAKNQVDSESIIAAMQRAGWRYSDVPEASEIVIVNTCGFIEKAKQESIDVCMELSNRCSGSRIILAGCLSQRYGGRLRRMMPEVDGFFGNRAPGRIPEMMKAVANGDRPVFLPAEGDLELQAPPRLSLPGSAYVKIAEGCDNRCAYCSIPEIRGGLKSRRVDDVVADVATMVAGGVREINLIAQDTGSFGRDRGSGELLQLLESILGLPGDFWIRLLYIHPDHFPEGLPELCRQDPRLLPYFDIPFQHASRRILSAMGRKGSATSYLDLVHRIRTVLPHSVIRSTFLLGFPGESESDFRILLDFLRSAQLEWVGTFIYSREEGTAAYRMQHFGALGHRLQARRAAGRRGRLQEMQQAITRSRLQRFVGREMNVLVEEVFPPGDLAIGRSYLHAPEVDGNVVLHGRSFENGSMLACRVTGVSGIDLEAAVIAEVEETVGPTGGRRR